MENESILTQPPQLSEQQMSADAPTEEITDTEVQQISEPCVEDEAEQQTEDAVDYARLAEEDLITLKEQFPSLSDMTSLSELENPARYGALRDLGLTVREAYLATTTPKTRAPHTYDNRSHLRSAVPRTHGAAGEQMSAQQMRAARELFSELSDSEIVKLYKKVHS